VVAYRKKRPLLGKKKAVRDTTHLYHYILKLRHRLRLN
jgi:hypothetical protein